MTFRALSNEVERFQFWRAAGRQHLPHKVVPAKGYIVDKALGEDQGHRLEIICVAQYPYQIGTAIN